MVNPPTSAVELSGLTGDTALRINSSGAVTALVKLQDNSGKATLDIAAGTIMKDSEGSVLASISVNAPPTTPAAPSGKAVVVAHDFGPSGATFSPAITITLKFDPDKLPPGAAKEKLVIAFWDGTKWVNLDTAVDAGSNTASAKTTHFTTFAVISEAPPPTPKPAAFTISGLAISPAQVNAGESVTISVQLANTGELSGSYKVTLKVNDIVEATEDMTVVAGTTQKVTFTTAKDTTGKYTVNVNGLSGNFIVKAVSVEPPLIYSWFWSIVLVLAIGNFMLMLWQGKTNIKQPK